MSYPPPGGQYPDPNQPDPNQQPGYGQQPGYSQQPGYGQQPGQQPGYGQAPGQQPGFGPPPGQPGYPAQPGFGPPPQKSKTGLIIGLAAGGFGVVVLVIILVLTLGGSSPTSTLESYIAAAKNGDLDTMESLTCEEYKSDFELADESERALAEGFVQDYFSSYEFELSNEQISGSEATVTVSATGPDGDSTDEIRLVDESGWKVCAPL